MMEMLRDSTVNRAQAAKLPPEKLEGKVVRGVFADGNEMGYIERYRSLVNRVAPEVKE